MAKGDWRLRSSRRLWLTRESTLRTFWAYRFLPSRRRDRASRAGTIERWTAMAPVYPMRRPDPSPRLLPLPGHGVRVQLRPVELLLHLVEGVVADNPACSQVEERLTLGGLGATEGREIPVCLGRSLVGAALGALQAALVLAAQERRQLAGAGRGGVHHGQRRPRGLGARPPHLLLHGPVVLEA